MDNNFESIREQYIGEARERWGDSEAFKESERRAAGLTASDRNDLYEGMDGIMEGFAKLNKRKIPANSEQARIQVGKLQNFISEKMYPCTDEILKALGQMYVEDERFTKNIDRHGEGTAAYISECISEYRQ